MKKKRDVDYNLKKKVKGKGLAERRATNPSNAIKYHADLFVKKDVPSFSNQHMWQVHTSKIHENNIKGIGSIL